MKISIFGAGYVGLVTAACLAELGNNVLCLDVDVNKIAALRRGEIPIYEPGLEEIVRKNCAAGRLSFTDDPVSTVDHGILQFIAVGTPPGPDGQADLKYVHEVARTIGQNMKSYRVVVDKSTVPVGTAETVEKLIRDELAKRNVSIEFSVASNPEFLKEGAAIDDFMRPDRVVLGVRDAKAEEILRSIYKPVTRKHERTIVMDVRSAELTKYAANAMLATRISFMNELANLAESVGADIEQVRLGIGSDARIGYHFLYAGCGYGGSCFPKDLEALRDTASNAGATSLIIDAAQTVNQRQKIRLVDKIVARFGEDLSGLRIAIWGLSFKPNTDDMREAPSVVVIKALTDRGASVKAYDPIAMNEARRAVGEVPGLEYCKSSLDALDAADLLLILTEWKEFRSPDFDEIKRRMKTPLVFDGRNVWEPALVRIFGIDYYGIGRSAPAEHR